MHNKMVTGKAWIQYIKLTLQINPSCVISYNNNRYSEMLARVGTDGSTDGRTDIGPLHIPR